AGRSHCHVPILFTRGSGNPLLGAHTGQNAIQYAVDVLCITHRVSIRFWYWINPQHFPPDFSALPWFLAWEPWKPLTGMSLCRHGNLPACLELALRQNLKLVLARRRNGLSPHRYGAGSDA